MFAAFFHLDEHAVGPEEVGELLAAFALGGVVGEEFELGRAGLFGDAEFQRGAGLLHAAVAQRAKEMVEEKLRLALLVALQRAGEGHKPGQGVAAFGVRAHAGEHA